MERFIEIFTEILFLGWPAAVVLVVVALLLFWAIWRRGSRGKA